MNQKPTIVLDLDGTLTQDDILIEYPKKDVQHNVKLASVAARKAGYKVHIFTARNMAKFSGDINKILEYTKPLTEEWLKKNEIQYDELTFGKPWAGQHGAYVDDKNMSLEEFVFKFTGPFSKKNVDIIIPFYNEAENVRVSHDSQKKLERLFEIRNFIYIDNGSVDSTRKELNKLGKQDNRVKIIELDNNLGYGNGLSIGLQNSLAEVIITNHGDNQFDTYSFLLCHLQSMMNPLDAFDTIIPKRLNRSLSEHVMTWILQSLVMIRTKNKRIDFNGQPKIFPRAAILNFEDAPKDSCFDLALVNKLIDAKCTISEYPILQKTRSAGVSSWSGSISKRIKVTLSYLIFLKRK